MELHSRSWSYSKIHIILTIVYLTIFGCRSEELQAQQLQQQQNGELYFSVSPEDHTVVEGLPVTLRCEAKPDAFVTHSWKIDGKPLAPSPRRHMKGSDLVITRVNRILDSGSFVCEATHEMTGASIESSPAKIDIQWISEANVQLHEPKPAPRIRAGGKVELRCHVDGSGELKYEWFRNTKTVHANERLEMKRNLLVIKEASPEDNGVYRCLARNNAGASPIGLSFPLIVPSSTNETAIIRKVPEKVIALRGDSASFSCVFDNADKIQWYYEEREPIDTDDERTVMDNGTLIILRIQDKDKGFYSCHGFKGDTAQIYAAELQIAYLKNLSIASFEPSLNDQLAVVGEGQELQVSCLTPGGLPTPKLFWRDPQGRIVSDSGHVRVQDDTLIIAKAKKGHDEGNYTCVAENMAGTTEMNVRVVVSWPPELRASPQAVNVLEDEPASLSCGYRAMESPITQTRWLKDGEILKDASTSSGGGPSRYRIIEHQGNSSLVFKNVQLSDRGSYICEIITKGYPSLKSKAATLNIREKLKFSPQPVNRRLELNSTAKVSCKAQGSSPPTFKWYKNGSDQFPKHVQEMNGTLQFNGVVEEDKGNYTCVAVNSQGQINHTIKIDVVISPKFTVKPENVTAIEGQSVLLVCAAEGDPKPTLQWDKDSQMNNWKDDRFVVMANGSLFIKEVYLSDEGKYGCTAGNSGGFKREEVFLAVRDGYRADMELDAADEGPMMTKTVIITLGAAAAYMVLVVGLMLYCRYRRRRRKQRYLQEQTDGQEKGENAEVQEEQCELRETNVKANSSGSKKKENRESHKSDGTDTAHSQNSNHSRKSKSSYDKLAVSRAHLQELKPLGRGEFGEIFSTKYRPTTSNDESSVKENIVLVKTLSNTKDENVLQEFKRHLDLLHKLNHENVSKLIGLCRDEEPDYMIIEYTDWGDLKQFLLASKSKETASSNDSAKPRAPQLTVSQILSLANQAARGLKHISDHRLVHKDVAARNCLISSNLTIKISLTCMTKEPHQQEYTKHRNQVIPIRWMPKEAVFEDEYSTKSDVYSYSVLLWEMFFQGELPFKKLNDDSILKQLKEQTLTWTTHKAAPPALQELQNQCWSYDPRDRPTFDDIVAKLQEIVDDCSQD